jgi:periplasmic protein TonB
MSDLSTKLDQIGRSTTEPSLRLGRLASPARESHAKSLFSNLRDFLTERPVKIRSGVATAFDMPGFGGGFRDNIKELFQAGPRGRVKSALLVNWEEEPSLWQNLRDWIAPRKLPPLQTTSQPVDVPEIWSKDPLLSRSQAVSVVVHVVVISLIVLVPLLWPGLLTPNVTKASNPELGPVTDVSPYLPKMAPSLKKAGGGGGQHDLQPAAKGKLPKFSWTQIARPMVHPPDHPEIAVTPTLLGNPAVNIPNINSINWGDPNGKNNSDSLGQGHGNGIGNGNGNGLGPGEGYNTGGGTPNAGTGGYGTPVCIYCPKAEYSDEAMKVKVQGVIELIAIVTADGRVTDVHVAKGLGFGLDEKAVEAVRTWRLTPARGPDGKPTTVRTPIELSFQLF